MRNAHFEYNIRSGTENDIRSILNLVKQLAEYERLVHQVTATETLYRRFGFGDRPYFHTLIAELNKPAGSIREIGFALYFFTFSTFVGKPTLYLEDLFVLPEYRGKGVGRTMLIELAKIAQQHECGRMEWMVLNWNEKAIRFYKSIGAYPLSDWTVFRLDEQALRSLANTDT